ncbi:MAG: hypothetical protein OHK0046_46050 [Anaerolineae bacterium]
MVRLVYDGEIEGVGVCIRRLTRRELSLMKLASQKIIDRLPDESGVTYGDMEAFMAVVMAQPQQLLHTADGTGYRVPPVTAPPESLLEAFHNFMDSDPAFGNQVLDIHAHLNGPLAPAHLLPAAMLSAAAASDPK